MRTQISAVFHLQLVADTLVQRAQIGNGIYIERLEPEWLESVKSQCPKIEARESIEWLSPYTHRFFYETDRDETVSEHLRLVSDDEKQFLLRAIVLSRLVKPPSIGYDSVWVKSYIRRDQTKNYLDQ